MALEFDNNIARRKTPIKRNNKFFGGEDRELQLYFAQEYMEQIANQEIILYQVDLSKTQVDDIYKEAKRGAIRFKPPVELTVVYEIQDAELKAYNNQLQKGTYAKLGKLTFSVLLSELEEKGCDIARGDYIGIQIDEQHREYWTVTDDGRVGAMSNKGTLYGTKPWFRKVECAPVDRNEFEG